MKAAHAVCNTVRNAVPCPAPLFSPQPLSSRHLRTGHHAGHCCSGFSWRAETRGQGFSPHRTSPAWRRRACLTRRRPCRAGRTGLPWKKRFTSRKRCASCERESAPRRCAPHEYPPSGPSNQCRQSARCPAGPALGAPAVVRQSGRGCCARQRHLGNHRRHRSRGAGVKSLLVLVEQQPDARLLGLLRPAGVTLISRSRSARSLWPRPPTTEHG